MEAACLAVKASSWPSKLTIYTVYQVEALFLIFFLENTMLAFFQPWMKDIRPLDSFAKMRIFGARHTRYSVQYSSMVECSRYQVPYLRASAVVGIKGGSTG